MAATGRSQTQDLSANFRSPMSQPIRRKAAEKSLIMSNMRRMGGTLVVMVLMVGLFNYGILSVDGQALIGTAKSYDPLPTHCSVSSTAENGMSAYVSSGLWEGGAACGRKYRIRCLLPLSGPHDSCKDETALVEVVGMFSTSGQETFHLSGKAFGTISKVPNVMLRVEYDPTT